MNDSSDSAALGELLAVVREQAVEIIDLDAPRAEAWASDVLALAAESLDGSDSARRLAAALAAAADDVSAAALAAIGSLDPSVVSPRWVGAPPAWVAALGTSRCEGAWLLAVAGAGSVAFRFVDATDTRHMVMVDLVSGPPETVGEVVLGPGDLLDALEESDAGIESLGGPPEQLAQRVAAASRATERPTTSAVANGRVLRARLGGLIADPPPPLEQLIDEVPDMPARDPADDAFALSVLRQALGDQVEPSESAEAVELIAAMVAPVDLAPFGEQVRDAILSLEWADWLGAVIGMVRAGPGAVLSGAGAVDAINRCPEVTTTIPKGDRARIEWAFETLFSGWSESGVVVDGRLTALGCEVLPCALARAWAVRRP